MAKLRACCDATHGSLTEKELNIEAAQSGISTWCDDLQARGQHWDPQERRHPVGFRSVMHGARAPSRWGLDVWWRPLATTIRWDLDRGFTGLCRGPTWPSLSSDDVQRVSTNKLIAKVYLNTLEVRIAIRYVTRLLTPV